MGQVHPESPACHLEVPEDSLVSIHIHEISNVMINNPKKKTGNYRH